MGSVEVPEQWDESYDVVVVGGGFAGLAAAYSAEKAGSSVVLVEKLSTTGGKHGGGAELTDEARQMIAAYDAYCEKLRAYGAALFEETFAFYNDIPKHELHRKEKTHD